MKIFILILCFLSILSSEAGDTTETDLISTCATGNPKNIAVFCLRHVQRELQKSRLNKERLDTLLADKKLRLTCWMGRYFASLKWKGTFIASELKDPEFTRWLINNPEIFEKLLFANKPNPSTLAILYQIYVKEKGDLPQPLLNLALGCSLSSGSLTLEQRIARYEFYKKSFQDKKLFPQFEILEPWEYALLLKDTESVEGGLETLEWGQEYTLSKKHINASNIAERVCKLIPYRNKNKKGISIHRGRLFYDNKPTTLQIYTEYGGVCGAVSKAACGFLKSRGIPCYTIGQPGHCAFVWMQPNKNWSIGNNIHGWNWSSGNPGLPWTGSTAIIKTLQQFHGASATSSTLCIYLADYLTDNYQSTVLLERAIEENPENYPAWKMLLGFKSKQISEEEKKQLAIKIRDIFKNNPFITFDLLYGSIDFNWKQTDPYEICALLLDDKETKDSEILYMKKLWELVRSDIPNLNLAYTEKNRFEFIKLWKAYYDDHKISLRMKKQTCVVLQKIVNGVTKREKNCSLFLDLYGSLLQDWKDKALMKEACQFIRSQLKNNQISAIRKNLIQLGMILSELTGDKRATLFYMNIESK